MHSVEIKKKTFIINKYGLDLKKLRKNRKYEDIASPLKNITKLSE